MKNLKKWKVSKKILTTILAASMVLGSVSVAYGEDGTSSSYQSESEVQGQTVDESDKGIAEVESEDVTEESTEETTSESADSAEATTKSQEEPSTETTTDSSDDAATTGTVATETTTSMDGDHVSDTIYAMDADGNLNEVTLEETG